jgi:outer membrane protein W
MPWQRTLLTVVLAATTVAPSAQASWLIGADAGVGIPTGAYSDFWSSGFFGGVAASYMLDPRFALGVDVSYTNFGTSSDYQSLLDFLDPGASNEFTTWQYGIHGNWMIPVKWSKVSPYLVVGTGAYSVSDEYESPTNSEELSQTAFGFRAGLGADYWTSPTFGIGIDANYNDTFTSEDTMGFSSTPYFTIAAGIRWRTASK